MCSRAREGADRGGSALTSPCIYIFMILFIYLGRSIPPILRLRPAGFCVIFFAVSRCTDPKYTFPITITHRTHTCTYLSGHTTPPTYRGACVPPGSQASSCSTYTHSFPLLPPPVSPPLTSPEGLKLSLKTFSRFLFLVLPV